jgi:hypothetical protein
LELSQKNVIKKNPKPGIRTPTVKSMAKAQLESKRALQAMVGDDLNQVNPSGVSNISQNFSSHTVQMAEEVSLNLPPLPHEDPGMELSGCW